MNLRRQVSVGTALFALVNEQTEMYFDIPLDKVAFRLKSMHPLWIMILIKETRHDQNEVSYRDGSKT